MSSGLFVAMTTKQCRYNSDHGIKHVKCMHNYSMCYK